MAAKMTGAGSPFKSRGSGGTAGDDDDVERAEFPSFTDLVADMTAAFSAGHNLALAMLDGNYCCCCCFCSSLVGWVGLGWLVCWLVWLVEVVDMFIL